MGTTIEPSYTILDEKPEEGVLSFERRVITFTLCKRLARNGLDKNKTVIKFMCSLFSTENNNTKISLHCNLELVADYFIKTFTIEQ